MAVAERTKASAAKARPAVGLKGEFYRQCRLWHGYLSAFAFLALIFFAVTGLLLNHPTWLAAELPAEPTDSTFTLPAPTLAGALKSDDPPRELAIAAGRQTRLLGTFQNGEVVNGQAVIRLEGVKGATDLAIDLKTGLTEVSVTRADVVSTINELHRGRKAGAAWRLGLDIAAIVILTLSIVGYLLFFSLRFRLRTSLVLTAVSLTILVGAFVAFVP